MNITFDTSEIESMAGPGMDRIERGLSKIQRMITLDIWGQLQVATPVDTGRARAGWIATVGKPAEGEGIATSLPQKIEPGTTSWIVNNVHYIVYLNEGHSSQAPAKFVERVISTVMAAYKR